MPADWDSASAQMDDAVDARLGDTIQLSIDGGNTFLPVKGYYLPYAAGGGLEIYDEPLGQKPRFKLQVKHFPGGRQPSFDYDRMRCAKAGPFTFRPSGSAPDEQGRYFIFDIQKV